MAFWDAPIRAVQNFFGGGNNQKKKKDEEKNQPRVGSSRASSTRNVPGFQNQPTDPLKPKKPENLFAGLQTNLTLPGVTPVKPKPFTPQVSDTERELNRLAEANLPKARKQVEQGQGLLDKTVDFFTGNNDKLARQNARNQAASQYQEKNGWKQDKEVMRYMGNTRKLGEKTSREIKTQGENLNRFEKGAYKAAEVAQYVPITGSVLNLGLAGSEAAGNKDMREVRNKVDFGMTNAEFDALDDETKGKLQTIRNIGLAASPLDFTGVGGLVKSTGASAAKKAVIQTVKHQAIDAATKTALKTAAKNSARVALPSAATGAGISLGAQQYLTGEMDPLEAAKAGLVVGGTSMLIPSQNIRSLDKKAIKQVRIPVGDVDPGGVPIPVRTNQGQLIEDVSGFDVPAGAVPAGAEVTPRPAQSTPLPTPIKELSGDTPGVNQVKIPTAQERFNEQPSGRPDRTLEGMLPGKADDTGIYSKAEIDAERAALDEALASGEINKTAHKEANKVLDELPGANAEKGAKIAVKEVKDIPVIDETVVPTDLPEKPGTVRVTASTDTNAAKSAKVAENAPVALPPEVQRVLDNPRQFNKRQVAAARNQAKLAKAKLKADTQTAETLEKIQSVSPAAQSDQGFVPTGEFGKSVNGGAYQKVNRQAEMQQAVQETSQLSPGDVVKTARANQSQTGGFNRRDIRNIAALFETKRLERGTPEWKEAREILKEDGTIWGQQGALRNYTMRRTASADELISRFESKIYRLADDPGKIDSKLFDEVDAAETRYVETRDAALQAYNRFTEAPTGKNAKAYHAAQDAADKADRDAKITEYKVAQAALKGNKDVKQVRELEKMAQDADMYQMDAVDASMLSGTGTFVRNFANASVGAVEESLFGKVSARLASLTPGARKNDIKVGGGTSMNLKQGAMNVVDASKARAGAAGKNPMEHIKNWATTGNQMGDAVIDTQVAKNVSDHYTQVLKSQGYKGSELKNRASVMARQDPDNMTRTYAQTARVAAGLGAGVTRNNKVETLMKNIISDGISGGNPNAVSENVGKLVTRMTIGFPTAIGRSVVEGTKRFTLGAPTFIKAMATKDPQARAILVKEGIKQAGTGGMVLPPLFYALGASGAITGGYPKDDPAEQERWKREGISENSIKIGDDYYQLPAYLGSWAIPGLFYAGLGRNEGDFGAAANDLKTVVPSLLPTDSISNITDVINGRTDFGKWVSQTGASAIRAATPGGALLNEIGKMLDPTQNETNDGSVWENLVDKVYNGIPGMNLTLDAKTDAEGNELRNPDPLALALGASSTEQKAGIERSAQLDEQTNTALGALGELGAFDDPNIKAVISGDEKILKLYNDALSGKQLNPDDLKKIQTAMVEGVSAKGEDTAYLEREQYDTNLTVLNIKKQLMAADPTTKPSDLEKLDVSIKRGEVYRDNEIPYELISGYQDTSLEEWRKMGDPESDDYDPEMYQQLWAIDELLTKAGASYRKGALDKQKFYSKTSGSGRRGGAGGGRDSFSAEFGKLDTAKGAPTVQEYDSIEARSGGVPVIQTQRPNIVHKIGFSG